MTTRRACAFTTLYLGRNPHQISFPKHGRTAYVATAGEDRITIVDGVPPH